MVDTLSELLDEWKKKSQSYDVMKRKDYGEKSPKQNEVIMTLQYQLDQCIAQLEAILAPNPMRDLLVSALLKGKNES
jgi:hypothetical protein